MSRPGGAPHPQLDLRLGRTEAIANLYDWFAAATLTPRRPGDHERADPK